MIKKIISFICVVCLLVTAYANVENTTMNKQIAVVTGSASISGPSTLAAGQTAKYTLTASTNEIALFDANLSISGGSLDTTYVNFGTGETSSASTTFSVTAGSSGSVVVNANVNIAPTGPSVGQTGSARASLTIGKPSTSEPSSPSPSNPGSNPGGNNTNGQTPSNEAGSEDKEEVVELLLASLSIDQGELKPAFDPQTTSYTVQLTSDKKEITVDAKAKDPKVTVSGTGKHEIKNGDNLIEIVAADEDGNTLKYTVNVQVEKEPEVYLTFDETGKKLGILELDSAPVMDGFDDKEITIDGKKVQARHNNQNGLTLLYMVDEKGVRNYYIYDEKKKEIVSIYIPVSLKGRSYAIVTPPKDLEKDLNVTKASVQIDKQNFDGWKFNDKALKNYALVYLMNDKGESNLYQFESTEDTLQLYSNTAPIMMNEYQALVKKENILPVMIGISGFLGVVVIGAIAALLIMKKRIRK